MRKAISIILGGLTLALPVISIVMILNDNGWNGMKVLAIWAVVASIYAIKG